MQAKSRIIGPTGGNPVTVNQQNSVSMGGGNDNTCIVSIDEPRGKIKPGGIWGHVKCTNFRNENDISETGCTLEAVFLFENCSG